MQLFQEANGTIRIINGEQEFTCPSEEFSDYEPAYEPLEARFTARIWTLERTWRSDGKKDYPDSHDCSGYIAKITTYQAAYDAAHAPEPLSLEEQQAAKAVQLKTGLNTYISGHFDQGTQASLTQIYLTSQIQAEKDAIKTVWGWIESVLKYYYTLKNAILATATPEELLAVTWDFPGNFDATVPDVQLEDYVN